MKKSFVGFAAAATCCFAFALFACGDDEQTKPKTPEKLRDGEAISLTVGGTKETDLSAYISVAGTDATYSVTSSAPEVVTVAVENTVATFSAVARGTATVTASAGDVDIEFGVTVYGKAASFDNGAIAYDLRTADNGSLTLAPNAGSGESTYQYTYTLKTANEHASITNNVLTVNYDEPVTETLTVNVSYTDSELPNVAARNAEFTVSVNVADTTPTLKAPTVEKEVDAATLTGETYDIDLAENILNPGNLTLTYSVALDNEEPDVLESAILQIPVPETVPDGGAEYSFTVIAAYGTGASEKLTYTCTVKFIDVSAYTAQNGGFDNDLTGWTASEDGFGSISEVATYWTDLPMHNDGKYFKSSGTGTLASEYFTVGGIDKISFKLGSGGKSGCYVTLENEDGDVLRIWRNYKFKDTGDGDADKVGKEKFIENFVTYIADLSGLHGQRVRIVIHDDEAVDDGFGIINFDSLVTYYAGENDLPTADKQDGRPVFDAVNELADMTALNTLLDSIEIASQGDYTEASYTAFTEKLAAAQAVANNIASKQAAVDSALSELNAAVGALAYRVPTEKDNTDKTFKILAGADRTVALSDYVDTKELSEITYEIVSSDTTNLTVSANETDNSYTLAVPDTVTGSHPVTVTITVKHKNVAVLTVTLTVTATNEAAPTLKSEGGIDKNIDLFDEKVTDKTKMTLDFAENVDNPKNLTLAYSVAINGGEAQTLTGSTHEFTFGEYTETATTVTFRVTVAFTVDSEAKSISYDYVLHLTDTRAYRIKNGGFDLGEKGLQDWTLSNEDLGAVNNVTEYWKQRGKFNNDGNFFNAYTDIGEITLDDETKYIGAKGGNEGAKGTLTSSPFKLGGSGWITYKLGGAKNADRVYLEVVDSVTGEVLDRFHNNAWKDETDGKKTGCSMTLFKADLHDHIGKTVYIRITDNSSNDYGLFFVDSFETYYTAEPQDTDQISYTKAVSQAHLKYSVVNGGFDGFLDGWTIVKNCSVPPSETNPTPVDIANCVIDRTSMWGERLPFNNVGKFLSGLDTGIPDADTWTVRSSEFVLGGSGWISLRMGGRSAAVKVYKADGTLLGEYRATHFHADDAIFPYIGDGDQKVSYADMRTYFIDLHEYVNEKLYIELCDREMNEGWAGATFDEITTYYATAPDTTGHDTVEAPVSGKGGTLVYENVELAWRVAVKHEENV